MNLADTIQLSVVIAASNDAERLPLTLQRLTGYLTSTCPAYEIIVVDDGSTDGTAMVVERAAHLDGRIRLIMGGPTRGRGFAVRCGCLAARGRLVMLVDAGFASPAEEWERLRDRLDEGHDVAVGSRLTVLTRGQPRHRRLIRMLRRVAEWVAHSGVHDTRCRLKLFRRHAARAIFSRARIDGDAFDYELIAIARALSLSIAEVPVVWVRPEAEPKRSVFAHVELLFDLIRIRVHRLFGVYSHRDPLLADLTARGRQAPQA